MIPNNANDKRRRMVMGTAYNHAIPTNRSISRVGVAAAQATDQSSYTDPAIALTSDQLSGLSLNGLPLCLEHDKNAVIGRVLMNWVDEKGDMQIVAEIDGETSSGQQVIDLVDKGQLGSFSVGYDVVMDEKTGNVARKEMHEISVVREPYFEGCNIQVRASKQKQAKENKDSVLFKQNGNVSTTTTRTTASSLPTYSVVTKVRASLVNDPQTVLRQIRCHTSNTMSSTTADQKPDAEQQQQQQQQQAQANANATPMEQETPNMAGRKRRADELDEMLDQPELTDEQQNEILRAAVDDPEKMKALVEQLRTKTRQLAGMKGYAKQLKEKINSYEARDKQAVEEYAKETEEALRSVWGNLDSLAQSEMNERDLEKARCALTETCQNPENYPLRRMVTCMAGSAEKIASLEKQVEELKKKVAMERVINCNTETSAVSVRANKRPRFDDVYEEQSYATSNPKAEAPESTQQRLPVAASKQPASFSGTSKFNPDFMSRLLATKANTGLTLSSEYHHLYTPRLEDDF